MNPSSLRRPPLRHLAPVLLALLSLGCARPWAEERELRLTSLSPSEAWSDEPVELRIEGTGLMPRLRADFDQTSVATVEDAFVVWMDEVLLEDVRVLPEGGLLARVPAGLTPQTYEVRVRSPTGASASLPESFTVKVRPPSEGDGGPEAVPPPAAVLAAALISPGVLRVHFTRTMEDVAGVLSASSYCIERDDGTPEDCHVIPSLSVTSVVAPGPNFVDLTLAEDLVPGDYAVRVNGLTDARGRPLAEPAHAPFSTQASLLLLDARSTGPRSVELLFSRSLLSDPATAACADATLCAQRFALRGPRELGEITSASVRPAPFDDRLVVTHSQEQGRGVFTIIGANGRSGDGFDNVAQEVVVAGNSALAPMPGDRALFAGSEGLPLSLEDGPLLVDPFGDGSASVQLLEHREELHSGANRLGNMAFRIGEGGGARALSFRFAKDRMPAGATSDHAGAEPTTGLGFAGCVEDVSCGPDNESGPALLASVQAAGRQWLVVGGARASGELRYVYVASDASARLRWQYVDLSALVGGGTRALSAATSASGRVYLGFTDVSDPRPHALSLLRFPSEGRAGLDPSTDDRGACDGANHDACTLAAEELPGVALGNSASIQRLDFLESVEGLLHLGNNGGLARSTTPLPRDAVSAPQDWLDITPSSPAFAAKTSVRSKGPLESASAQRAWSPLVRLAGRLYLARNTVDGAQLWRCEPWASPPLATCEASEWSLIAGEVGGDPDRTAFGDGDNLAIGLLASTAGTLWVGFDNASTGVQLFRSITDSPASVEDFAGANGCVAGVEGCQGIGGNGLGAPASRRRFFSAAVVAGDLYVAVGDGLLPVSVFRQQERSP